MIETLAELALRAGTDINRVERSSTSTSGAARPEAWLVDALGGRMSAAGVRVNPDSALGCTAVYACVRLLSESVAGLPLFLFRRQARGRSVATEHPLYRLLHNSPNPWQTSFEWREMMQGHLLLRGNCYSYVLRNSHAEPLAIIPLHPDYVTIMRAADGEPFYRVAANSYTQISGVFSRGQIFHVRGMSSDGYCGMSPIAVNRETIGMAIATREYGARLFSNGARPSGVLEYPTSLTPEIMARVKDSWNRQHGGLENAHRVAVLENGMKWHQVGLNSDDAQYLETRGFENREIYQIYGVPPHMVGDNEKTTSWGTGIEQMSIGFVTYTLRPWLVRWEQAISEVLLLDSDRDSHYAMFSVDGLLRGDSKTRSEALAIRRQNGVINANEWRDLEDMDPIPGAAGEAYLVNGAMISVNSAAAATRQSPQQAPKESESTHA